MNHDILTDRIAEKTKPINYVKGWAKNLYNILTKMTTDNASITDKLKDLVNELVELSHREKMNDHIYMFSRRHKAVSCLILLESIKGTIPENEFEEMKKLIKNIFLENRTKQLLPNQYGILKSSKHKTELYLNKHPFFDEKVLEPREYIGIDPEAHFDLDAPSIVTALTPAKYEQPVHNHENNWEVTFYTGPSIGKFYDKGTEHSLEADFGDFIIFPPKTYHTINNPNDFPVRNISIKLPGALLDRSNVLDKNEPGTGEVVHIDDLGEGIFHKSFPTQGLTYDIFVYDFNQKKEFSINPKGKSVIYTLDGDFLVMFAHEGHNHVISESDIVILNNQHTVNINRVNGSGRLYMVTLH